MRIPSLDGLRAASIVLVLFAHTAGTTRAPDLAWLQAIGDIGHLGVRVFFVISGLLMTILLEREFDLTGRISLAAFLQRRAIRIVPAFGAYVAVIGIAGAAGIVVLRPRDLLMAATFTMNYHADRAWYLGHLWSLSVEAQFYIIWAIARMLVGRNGMFWVAAAGLALGPVTRVAVHVLAPDWRWAIGEAFPTIIDALATGGLLAVVHEKLARSHSYVTPPALQSSGVGADRADCAERRHAVRRVLVSGRSDALEPAHRPGDSSRDVASGLAHRPPPEPPRARQLRGDELLTLFVAAAIPQSRVCFAVCRLSGQRRSRTRGRAAVLPARRAARTPTRGARADQQNWSPRRAGGRRFTEPWCSLLTPPLTGHRNRGVLRRGTRSLAGPLSPANFWR